MSNYDYLIEVEGAKESVNGTPSAGPVYRSIFARDGFPPPVLGLESCWDIFRLSVERNPHNRMLGRRKIDDDGKAGEYVWLSYKEVYDTAIKVGTSIRSCGVGYGGRCGIYGVNCPEWVISMEACNAHGIYCVPLYDSLGAGAIEFIICNAEVEIAFVEEKKISELLKTFPNSAKFLKTIVSFGKVSFEQKEEFERFGVEIYSWEDFLFVGDGKQFDLPTSKKTDICTIMYTSGTTGDPKGVMISHNSIIAVISGVVRLLYCVDEQLHDSDVYLSYLPLAHIFDRVIEETFIFRGASIGFWRGDVKLLIEDIGELKPTIFCAVPRVLDRVYTGLQTKISSGGFLKHALFKLAYYYKEYFMRKGFKQDEAAIFFDKIVFSKVKKGLGGNVRIILSGAAPLASHVEAFLRVVSCAHVLQGYGDIGEWQPNGSLKIIDRKKNIFKLSQGEYVAVENLENIYGLVPEIDSIWIYGNSFESFLVAVINPNQQALEKWAEENRVTGDFAYLCENTRVREYILGELAKTAKAKKLKGFEFIKAVHLDPEPFDMERDLLTPTFKKKRPQLLKHYKEIIEGMYKKGK